MAAKQLIGTVQSTELEKSLGRTIMNGFYKKVDSEYISHLQDPGENFLIPILENMLSNIPALNAKLVELYNKTFGTHKKVMDIPDEIKAIQGALLDGLVFGYDPETDSMDLYTMNSKLLFGMGTDVEFIDDKVVDKNIVGEYKGYRIDITYKDGSKSFEFKAVNHRKKLDSNIVFVPYLAILRGMKLVESFIDGGAVLSLIQSQNGLDKTRVVTKSTKLLEEFCDDPAAVEYITCQYFPLKGICYLPVVGAPSTTAMVTKVELLHLMRINKLKNKSELKKLNVYKPENPIRTMLAENTVVQVLEQMDATDHEGYMKLIKRFPKSGKYLEGEVSPVMISKYLHQISEADAEKVYGMVPGVLESMGRKSFLMNDFKVIYKQDGKRALLPDELESMAEGGIIKVLCRKQDCTTYTVIGTNNERLLEALYGNDYAGKFEGESNRLYNGVKLYKEGWLSTDDICDKFNLNLEAFASVERLIESGAHFAEIKKAYAEVSGSKFKYNFSGSSAVTIRGCFAGVDSEGKVSQYYQSVIPEMVLQVSQMSGMFN